MKRESERGLHIQSIKSNLLRPTALFHKTQMLKDSEIEAVHHLGMHHFCLLTTLQLCLWADSADTSDLLGAHGPSTTSQPSNTS